VSAELDEQYEGGGGVVYCPRTKWNKEASAAVYASAEVVPRRAWVPPRRGRGERERGKTEERGKLHLEYTTLCPCRERTKKF